MTQGVEVCPVDLNFEMNRVVGFRLYRHIKQVMQELDDRECQDSGRIKKIDCKIE